MPLWLLAWALLAVHVTAFLGNRQETFCLQRPVEKRSQKHTAKSLLDDPLLLEPSSVPGEDNEVVVSKSPAFGLQRILYRHKRALRAKGPHFNRGDAVYLCSGPYRGARGTVLATHKTTPGDPCFVTVALDCRNERGIVKKALAEYHGTRVTVAESQLTSRALFSPYTPPPLSREDQYLVDIRRRERRKSRVGNNIIGMLLSRISSSTTLSELMSILDVARRAEIKEPVIYQSALIQIARSHHTNDDPEELKTFVNETLRKLSKSLSDEVSPALRESIPWTAWAMQRMYKRHLIDDYVAYCIILSRIKDLVLNNRLTDLTQGDISLLAVGFSEYIPPCKDLYHRLAMLYSYFHPGAVNTRRAAQLANGLVREGVQHQGFTNLLCKVVKNGKRVLSAQEAVLILDYLSSCPDVPREIKDELLASCSVAEFLRPEATPNGPSIRHAIRLARLNNLEMEELCTALRSRSFHIPLTEIMWAIYCLRYTPQTSEACWLLIVRASRHLNELVPKEFIRVLNVSRKLHKYPLQLVDALYSYLQMREEEFITDPGMLKALASILTKIPESRQECQVLILKHIERFIVASLELSQDNAIDEEHLTTILTNVTECLQHITLVGYEVETMAKAAAKLIRSCIKYSSDRARLLLSILSIKAMCNSYFEAAAKAARSLLSDPKTELDEEVAPLAELLLMVKATIEGKESISSIGKDGLGPLPASSEEPEEPDSPNVKDYPLMFSLMVRSNLLDVQSGILNDLYVFAEDNLDSLSNADLVLMRDGLVALGAFDQKWVNLIDSIPKGIDAVTED